jgi:hypothetical protein
MNKILQGTKRMLDTLSWVKMSKQCWTLVDTDCKVMAVIYTAYDEDDGDENFIWDVEIEGEEFGSYVSLYCAKMAVQKAIYEFEAKMAASEKRAKTRKKKEVKVKSVAKK